MDKLFFGTGDFSVRAFAERSVEDEIRMVMTAFDSVVEDDTAVYCSTETTTGRRLHDRLFTRHGVRSDPELRAKLGEAAFQEEKTRLFDENVRHGQEFASALRRRGLAHVICPGCFVAPGFTQEHYLYLWEWVILKKAREVHFNLDWEYSDGCSLEYAVAIRKGIPALDVRGYRIEVRDAARMIERAARELRAQRFPVPELERHLAMVRAMEDRS